jgi:hypothetical protein
MKRKEPSAAAAPIVETHGNFGGRQSDNLRTDLCSAAFTMRFIFNLY